MLAYLDELNWGELIQSAEADYANCPVAEQVICDWPDRGSLPVRVRASDGGDYVIKGLWADPDRKGSEFRGRAIAIEHVMERLGTQIGAPVPPPLLVTITPELSRSCPELVHLRPGIVHGSTWVGESRGARTPREDDQEPGNRMRYALIAVLYGWIADVSNIRDSQVIFLKEAPELVFSVDHDLFWKSIPAWDDTKSDLLAIDCATQMAQVVGPASPIQRWYKPLQGDAAAKEIDELREACWKLEAISPGDIAEAIAEVPDEWGLDHNVRNDLAEYLEQRRHNLIAWPSS